MVQVKLPPSTLSSYFWRFAKTSLFLLLMAAAGFDAQAQNALLRGFVSDADDQEPLQGVNVILTATDGSFRGASTSFEGLYVITEIVPGRYVLQARYIGYATHVDTLDIVAGEIRSYNITIGIETTDLDELVVEGEREGAGAAAVIAGLQTIRPQDIDLIPAPDVSGDLVNYLTTLPGVVSVGDQGGQFFVRGGEPTQNLVLLDGMLVFQPFHLVGFYSAFPSSIINVADVYAGGFGAEFGGRMSSVIDITTRNGNKRRVEGEISVAPFMSAIRLEGPIIRDRISILLSGRMSVIEQGIENLISDKIPYAFSDQFGKLHANLGPNSQFSFTGLRTYDRGTIDPVSAEELNKTSEQIIWRNEAYGLRYLLLPTSMPVQAEILMSISRIENTFGEELNPARSSSASQFNFATNMTHFMGKADVKWGIYLNAITLESELGGAFQGQVSDKEYVTEVGGYLETEFGAQGNFRFRPGLRVASFPSNSISFLEPRLRLVYEVGIHRFSAAWGIYHQEIVGLADRRDAGDVFTAWANSPKGQVPQATHAIAGYQIRPSSRFKFAFEGYYKSLSNLSIAEWTAFPRFTTAFQPADGDVKGFDARMELNAGPFYGFVNYGYAEVEYRALDSKIKYWFGSRSLTFSPPHDRRHQINVLTTLKFNGFNFSVRWQYGSGLPFSQALGFDEFILMDGPTDVFEETGDTRVLYGKPYRGRLPDYHRLDVSLDKTFSIIGRSRLTLQTGLTNAYNRDNLFYIDLFTLRRLNQLPMIPSIGLKLEF